MPLLTSALGTWNLPHFHRWQDRGKNLRLPRTPLVGRRSRIATIGSCFATELAASMQRWRLLAEMHPASRFYNTRSIRQEMQRIFGTWEGYQREPMWRDRDGFVHPFKSRQAFATETELRAWSDSIDAAAAQLFRTADIIVITLGLIEAWRNPTTGNTFIQMPPPDVFERLSPEFYRLTVADMADDLNAIHSAIRSATQAEIVVTVSPIPLHATMTAKDVRVANAESKARIRAAVSEFVDAHPEVHYFPSFEMVSTAEALSDFMLEDGRHLHRYAVDYIMHQFLTCFAAPDVTPGKVDTSWLREPTKLAARADHRPSWARRIMSRLWSPVKKLRAMAAMR
ncbi:MAG: GSCFA domain-containing protein [Planctomycetia bacterium]|nr:GSCFA domain-containing protein [Planctomycetia bacterium]